VGAFSPDVERVINTLHVEDVTEIAVVAEKGILFPDYHDDIHLAKILEDFRTGQVGEKMNRSVVID